MADTDLKRVPDVDIDEDGVFKYVLIRVTPRGSAPGKDVVRGYSWAEYHADIYDRVSEDLSRLGFKCECRGGGRISRQSSSRRIHVYGYSVGFGRAEHSVATEKLSATFPDYEVTWADDGY
ncbi:14 kDa phosphohistidine phosphatase [Lacerta agilis]|uniref:14 kDa phosphohistidine phosphatase n=1 Tax=Lacerta agilis TaxID=80427 RepID=UPI00141A4C2C|nr:14 kDa phosphohistidine phosphatase [Lacerta agilis]